MSYQDYLPSTWIRNQMRHEHPLVALRKEVDDLFDDFGDGFFSGGDKVSIRSNVSETDKEFSVTAELPGLTEADVDVSVTGDRIVIKGEKKSEKEERSDEEGREFHRVERTSGSFQRMMTLPFAIDPDKVEAVVKDGVLTVTIPKPPEAVEKTKKIKVAQAK
ncbi:Hsp20/alpha crystallin family protein [uncultured Sulfitobacter sp.]|uniref:Hsp20/alpha crystallin family protein n=1 Tax=uncultured Sulfitobacter sp. TaxID=191468 RepID=UPI0026080BD4|nr:Hsp20/alpha crystallin family protein [uncultured Sulfitobacter sp.]